jgi:hypothetical protein
MQAIPTDTTIFVVPLIGLLALGLVIAGIIVFVMMRRRGTGSLGQEDSWLQE